MRGSLATGKITWRVFTVRKGKEKRRIRMLTINLSFVVIVAVFSAGMLIMNGVLQKKYNEAVRSQEMLIACNAAADALQSESDALTLCVNDYVDTGSTTALWQYYSIINNRLREQELERAEGYAVDCTTLREALALSDELARREAHAFSLIAQANGTLASSPAQVLSYVLPPAEQEKSAEEKMELAHRLIHGKEYNTYKKSIYQKIDTFQTDVLAVAQDDLFRETQYIRRHLQYLRLITVTGNVLVILMAAVLYKKVTVVLRDYIVSIKEKSSIAARGTAETQYLARVFNDYLTLQKKEKEELRKRASIDPLTQVANRQAFDDFIIGRLSETEVKGAFLFLDVDNFKRINDTYGHDTGDLVLQCLVAGIRETLTEKDMLGRLGGDEFAVWLDGLTAADAQAVEERVAAWGSKVLSQSGEELEISVSAGVYFCTQGDSYGSVFKRADLALYQEKRSGKGGVGFYKNA